jgi:hypothetical protein
LGTLKTEELYVLLGKLLVQGGDDSVRGVQVDQELDAGEQIGGGGDARNLGAGTVTKKRMAVEANVAPNFMIFNF